MSLVIKREVLKSLRLNIKHIFILLFTLIFISQDVFALTYTVKPGDFPEKIAKKFGISVKTLLKVNNIKDPKKLRVGQKLYIPVKNKSSKKRKRKKTTLRKGDNCKYVYTVKRGDVLSLIAKRFGVSTSSLKKWNNLKSNRIYVGQKLCIKPLKSVKKERKRRGNKNYRSVARYKTVIKYYRVKRGDSLIKIAKKFGVSARKIAKLNHLKKPYKLRVGQRLKIPKRVKVYSRKYKPVEEYKPKKKLNFKWPVEGKVIKGFINSENERHVGIDIKAKCGDKIVASEDGKVIYAGNSIKTFGNLIIIRHPNRYNTVYGHIGQILVKDGAKVKKGEVIGTVGKLDNDNCGIYFEVRKYTIPVNPLSVLEKK